MQANFVLVFCAILILFGGLIGRIVYLNKQNGERYERKVLSQQSFVSNTIPYKRGTITDRNGAILAKSDKVVNVILDPKVLLTDKNNIKVTLEAISEIFEMDYSDLSARLNENSESSYVILRKHQEYNKKAEFEKRTEEQKKASRYERIVGVWFEDEYIRSYPYGSLASNILGYTNSGNAGSWGVEQYYNTTLNGTNGRIYGYYDSELNLVRTEKSAVNGYNLVTTIDANVQQIVEKHVKDFRDTIGSENIGVILMDPNSGEIYAMVSNGGFDLNNPRDLSSYFTEDELERMDDDAKINFLSEKVWKNYCISDAIEPGSTFKPFTVAAALEEDKISPDATYECTGSRLVGGWVITCNKKSGHGYVTLTQALTNSCNPALMTIGDKLGRDLFCQYQYHFGFGKKTGIDLPGEGVGILKTVAELNVTELATSSFGQTSTVTMIQLISGFASLVNGGHYYQPHVVKEIVNDNGATVEEKSPVLVKETISAATSQFLKEAAYLTVEEGTATVAKMEGYLVGGKTGTAQKLPRSKTNQKYIVSFIGSVPADNPELIIYVAIDEVHDEEKKASSSVASALTKNILSEVLPFLGIYPDGEIDYHVDIPQVTPVPNDPENEDPDNQLPVYDPSYDEINPDAIPETEGNTQP